MKAGGRFREEPPVLFLKPRTNTNLHECSGPGGNAKNAFSNAKIETAKAKEFFRESGMAPRFAYLSLFEIRPHKLPFKLYPLNFKLFF